MRIKDLSTKSGNPTSSDYFVLDNGTLVTKIDYTKLAKAIIENYNGSTLAGSAQSVKAALDSLNSNSVRAARIGGTTGNVNMRDAPSGSGSMITTIPNGDFLFALGSTISGGFRKCAYFKVSDNTWYVGYVASTYVILE